jgi:hypothetical protein
VLAGRRTLSGPELTAQPVRAEEDRRSVITAQPIIIQNGWQIPRLFHQIVQRYRDPRSFGERGFDGRLGSHCVPTSSLQQKFACQQKFAWQLWDRQDLRDFGS